MTARQYDAIVVGAGVMGSSLAWELSKRGSSVLIVDAVTRGAGTSASGAGFVGTWAAGYMPNVGAPEVELARYGVGFYARLHEQADIEYKPSGSMFVAVTDAGAERVATIASHPLAPEGTRALTARESEDATGGLLDASVVINSVLHPSGIQISAGKATIAAASRAVDTGASILENTRVIGADHTSGDLYTLRTTRGEVSADKVVIAAGAWTNEVLAYFDAQVPLARHIASRVVSPPSGVASPIPTVMVPEWHLWLREEQGGLTWANTSSYGPLTDYAPSIDTGGHPAIEQLIERMLTSLLPDLKRLIPRHDLSVQSWTQGLPCFTPDGRFIAGEISGSPGLYVLAGDNEAGVTHGPGLAHALAEHMLGCGTPLVDLARYSPSRFGSRPWTEAEVLSALPEYE